MSRSAHFRNLVSALLMPLFFSTSLSAGDATATGSFEVKLSAAPFAERLLPESPFGINTAFQPDAPNLEAILNKMKDAGIKWGRQDFTWRRIEKEKGKYQFADYDRLVELCRQYGLLLFGNLAYAPDFHDPRTPEGVRAYCDFARATVRHPNQFCSQQLLWPILAAFVQFWNLPKQRGWVIIPCTNGCTAIYCRRRVRCCFAAPKYVKYEGLWSEVL
ncbi:MAG TPA: hypothetical protein VJJ98_03465 [Sedimentisphaerales bacterium]|nr:hypothetical protein [Sedimentisphaerales bacterium]